MSMLHVVKPGLLTTIQDRGRWGYQSWGVPVAGPMDPISHRIANAIVGNPAAAATLEITLIGPELEFEDERAVAVSGALFELTLDGQTVPLNRSIVVPAGSRLRFGRRVRHARAYLAVEGGVAVPMVFGSRATHVTSGMGGIEGRALSTGDHLPLGPRHHTRTKASVDAQSLVEFWSGPQPPIRVIPGPNREAFTADALEILQSAPYSIGTNSDRMGFRLEGPLLTHTRGGDIISDATPLGALQVPSAGQPILLMADRQTTGGYPKVATVISADISRVGQLGPGDTLSFALSSAHDALAALVAQERWLMALEARTQA
jgi:antagonist of KipI